jgi:hypothetical protein
MFLVPIRVGNHLKEAADSPGGAEGRANVCLLRQTTQERQDLIGRLCRCVTAGEHLNQVCENASTGNLASETDTASENLK